MLLSMVIDIVSDSDADMSNHHNGDSGTQPYMIVFLHTLH